MRNDPRISVSKLGEYLTAGPRRRRSIVGDQKRPNDFVVIWYTEARRIIVDCILRGLDGEVLENGLAALEAALASARADSNDAARAQVSIDGIDAFASGVMDRLALDGLPVERGEPRGDHLTIGGVAVSVSPDLLVRTDRGVGVVVLYFSKSHPLDDDAGAYVASLVQQFVEERLGSLGPVDPSACRVVDVLAGRVHTAPKSYKRRRRDIEAACQEIAAIWAAA